MKKNILVFGLLLLVLTACGSAATPPALPTESSIPIPTEGSGGRIVFYSNRDGDTNHIFVLNIARLTVNPLTQGDESAFSGPFSPDGSRILFTGFGLTNSYVGVMNADGSKPANLSNQPNADDGFSTWSPDGNQIAFTSRRDGNNEIYIMNADGSNPRRITNTLGDDFAPSWSPDGRQIAFLSDRDNRPGIYAIYTMSVNGANIQRLTNDSGNDYTPAWSPDGRQIAFRLVQNGQSDIYRMNADGSGLVNLTDNPAEDWAPSWSPDGSQIAFQSNRDGNWEIYMMNADGSDPVNVTNNPVDDQLPFWGAPADSAGIANPASENCIQQGGTLNIEQRGDLGSIGVCYFEDNRQCEEWALLRGDCTVGGRKVTGYVTEAGRFCAISGGEYAIAGNNGATDEQGTCTFKNGKTCDAWEYYNGTCSPSD